MNDVERELRELLQRKADGAGEPWGEPEAPIRVLRRVRRRQALTTAVAGLTAAAVALGAFLGVRAVLGGPAPVVPGRSVITATVNGVTITYPEGWYLVDPSDRVAAAFPGELVLMLSNVEPTDEILGCPGAAGSGVVLMTVERTGLTPPEAETTWPVEPRAVDLGEIAPGDAACYPGWGLLQATWVAAGGAYDARIGIGPDATGSPRDAVLEAFRSMRFDPPGPDAAEAYTLGRGIAAGVDWTFVVRREGGSLTYELTWEDGGTGFGAAVPGEPIELALQTFSNALGVETVVFGVVMADASRVEIGRGESDPVVTVTELVPIPGAPDLVALAVTVPGEPLLAVAYDAEGAELGRRQLSGWSEAPPPVEPVHGGTYWAVYVAVGEPGSREIADAAERLEELGVPHSVGDVSCDQGTGLSAFADAQRVAVYFDDEEGALLFAESLIGPPAAWVGQVTTYCLD
ncbi:MAG: hypothetical protein HY658_03910 [Actinobacteria bacterium]|nr:hypothetical protein [Actinomycetota bacterium]